MKICGAGGRHNIRVMKYLIGFEKTMAALGDYAAAVGELYKTKLAENEVSTTEGTLARTAKTEVRVGERGFQVVIELEDYWRWVEYGRRPGKYPPPGAILRWVQIKPIIARPDKRGIVPTDRSLAFLIGRKIAKEGIEAKPLLHDSVEEINRYYLPKVEEALAEDVGAYVLTTMAATFDNLR